MSKTDAEYMRAYRARRKAEQSIAIEPLSLRDERIAELEAEVKHLKAELAKRPEVRPLVAPVQHVPGHTYQQDFRPAPKPAPKHR
jgi:predicted ABC-type exoprotein transport system permease subunit